jgi:DNA-binding response OmpR family regulator
VFTSEELLRSVWGVHTFGRTRTLDSHAIRLRGKLCDGAHDKLMVNVWGRDRERDRSSSGSSGIVSCPPW